MGTLLHAPRRKHVIVGVVFFVGQLLLRTSNAVAEPWRGILTVVLFVWAGVMIAIEKSAQNEDDKITKLIESRPSAGLKPCGYCSAAD